jgi:hypothetical protein
MRSLKHVRTLRTAYEETCTLTEVDGFKVRPTRAATQPENWQPSREKLTRHGCCLGEIQRRLVFAYLARTHTHDLERWCEHI